MEATASYRWTVEFQVDAVWVADGYNLTAERAKEMLAGELRDAFEHEIAARIISAPHPAAILAERGHTPPFSPSALARVSSTAT
jgi:hypothetical protein